MKKVFKSFVRNLRTTKMVNFMKKVQQCIIFQTEIDKLNRYYHEMTKVSMTKNVTKKHLMTKSPYD